MVFHLYHCNDSPNPSPQPSPSYQTLHRFHNIHIIHMALIAMACFVTTIMLLLTLVIFLRRHNHDIDRDRRNSPILFDVHGYRDSTTSDNGPDDDDESVVDHPTWFIRTTGLQQSVIDSITVLKYRKNNEGLVDGTECSVCLGEFQEEESLRVLPKCSHAFHIHCIDTWLRSHQNCPLCRAPVLVNDAAAAEVSVTVTDNDRLDSNISEESRNQEGVIENFDNVVVEGIGLGEFHVVRIDNDNDDIDSVSVGVSSSERSYKNNTA